MVPTIRVIGLGSGGERDLSPHLLDQIRAKGEVFMRTEDFPLTDALRKEGIRVRGFDSVYGKYPDFASVYEEVARTLIEEAKRSGEIVYLVPGHPRVAERTVELLLQRGGEEGVRTVIEGGHSFLDQAFTSFGFDPIEGFLLLDGTSLRPSQLNPDLHLLVAQVYDRLTASDVKLTLMEAYPDEYPVYVGTFLGTEKEEIRAVPLYQLDHLPIWNNYCLVYLPPAREEQIHYRRFSFLQEVVARLRSPEGCPWDREQTHQSLRKYLLEETYEVLEAIDLEDMEGLQEELGDLLLQILLHSQIASEEGYFGIDDVIRSLSEKLIRRHPHVFGKNPAASANEAVQNWQEIKKEEKKAKGAWSEDQSVLSGIPKGLPAISHAYELQRKAAKVGFDWDELHPVLEKVEEEWQEFRKAKTTKEQQEELGDLLFAIVNVARFLKMDPEEALAKANLKFKSRFRYVERSIRESGRKMDEVTLDEMESLWQQAKKMEEIE